MEKQKKNDSGITLVALVVSIIVMLVLAGVSLNATIGENGIVTRAQEAALKQKMAEDLENLNLELAKLNIDTISTDESQRIEQVAQYLANKGVIDSFVTTSAGQIAAGIDTATGNKYFFGTKGDNTYKITRGNDGLLSAEVTTYTSGGDITGGYSLVTAESFTSDDSLPATEKGKFTITDDAEVVFMDSISGALSIYVKSGVHATVGIYADMDLTNQGIKRSAIHIESNGTLDMYIADGVQVHVNSGLGDVGEAATAADAKGGAGGYAGIYVPWLDSNNNKTRDNGEYATLNLYGSGTLYAYGGNAGRGQGSKTPGNSNTGGGGGGGAGAGIGGNGGAGGNANSAGTQGASCSGHDGEPGENAGTVNIHNSVTVYAYGGAGGGTDRGVGNGAGVGGGGYPAAGIGGGGAGGGGGDHACGAGGYSGGGGENTAHLYDSDNGRTADKEHNAPSWGTGGAYFESGSIATEYIYQTGTTSWIGGQGGHGPYNTQGGDGGVAGKGGIINVSSTASDKVFAFNGNECTLPQYIKDEDGNSVLNENYYSKPVEIYAQNGVLRTIYKYTLFTTVHDYRSISFFKDLLGEHVSSNIDSFVDNTYVSSDNCTLNNFIVRSEYKETGTDDEDFVLRTKYINPQTNTIYGVGSGAGYIELDNGEYNIVSSLN